MPRRCVRFKVERTCFWRRLSFLDGANGAAVDAWVDQGLRVRPHDADVLFEVGRQNLIAGDVDSAVSRWKQCFNDTGPHQLKIVYLLAGRIAAAKFLESFQPDWRTLRGVWARYRELGQQSDMDAVLSYAANCAEHETEDDYGLPPAYVWFWQAQFYAEAERPDDALRCLQRAYACGPRHYFVRAALAQALQAAGRFAEAEPHLRWCLARRPDDKNISYALFELSKQRLAERESMVRSAQQARLGAPSSPPFSSVGQQQLAPVIQTQFVAPAQPQVPAATTLPFTTPQ